MSDEPTLPCIPSRAADAIFGPSRKRVRPNHLGGAAVGSSMTADQLLLNSSDPAVFSSDDDPALDNYGPTSHSVRRKKKRYVGAWFAQHPASTDSAFDETVETVETSIGPDGRSMAAAVGGSGAEGQDATRSPVRQHKKRTLARQFDSGVWMGREAESVGGFGGGVGSRRIVGVDGDDDDNDGEDSVAMEHGLTEVEDVLIPSTPLDNGGSSPSTSSQLSLAPVPIPMHLHRPVPTDDDRVWRFSSRRCGLPMSHPPDAPSPPPRQPRRTLQRVASLAVNAAEKAARALITDCIDTGNEEVSLIDRNLTTLTNATIEPLSQLVPIPVVTEGVAFEQREPELKLFLSRNQLTILPGALFELEHLTVLSLRGNHLTELPPAIGRLRNLRSLNVSLNSLRFLPAELLPLFPTFRGSTATELLLQPNPFFMPDDAAMLAVYAQSYEQGIQGNAGSGSARRRRGLLATRACRTPVRYLDSAGTTLSAFAMEPWPVPASGIDVLPVEPLDMQSVSPRETRQRRGDCSSDDNPQWARVPTLMELVLETCYRAPQLAELPALLPAHAPNHLAQQLRRALEVRNAGGAVCSVCGSVRRVDGVDGVAGSAAAAAAARTTAPLVAPMTEWIEWYEFASGDLVGGGGQQRQATADADEMDTVTLLPFVFRGCSWGCVPAVAVAGAS